MGPLKLITAWFSPLTFATLSAIFVSVGTAGNIAAATPLVWLAQRLGWRQSFLLFAVCNVVVAVVFYLIARNRPDQAVAGQSHVAKTISFSKTLSGIGQLLIRRDYWLISTGTFFRYGIYAAVQALWAGPFLMLAMGLSAWMTGNLLLTMSIGLIIGSPICGWLSDSIIRSRKTVIMGGLAVMAGILITLALLPDASARSILFALFFGLGFSSGAGQIMYAHIKERVPLDHAGAAMTGINFFTMIGVAVFLHGLGWAINTFCPAGSLSPEAFRWAFGVFGACLLLTGALYSLTAEDKQV
jgi:sugar phosphate permease